VNIRPFHPSDIPLLYKICLQTGFSGKDASPLFKDPNLLGHVFAAPYAFYERDLLFIATRKEKPCGYILGAKESAHFFSRLNKDWYPPLRKQYPLPDDDVDSYEARIIRIIHGISKVPSEFGDYPAHLHINLLPVAQGHGMGRKLMNIFFEKLRSLSIPGVHLGVGKANPGAILFYERLGFERLKEEEKAIVFGMKL